MIWLFAMTISTGFCRIKIACIGNSITYGLTIPQRESNSYPAKLQQLLGDGFEVRNFGHSGATLLKHGHNPYVATPEWTAAKHFAPDIAIIHLGTNDTDPRNWPNYSDEFVTDYLNIIDTLKTINPDIRIIIANLAPIRAAHRRFKTGTCTWRDSIRNVIPVIARYAGAELIDFADPLKDFPNLMPDAVHPDKAGAEKLAQYSYGAVSGKFGGLKLPEIWQNGMIVQCNTEICIKGQSDAGQKITVTANRHTVTATADNLGRWQCDIGPFEAGEKISIDITDGQSSIALRNIKAGEVWLASGQSNMEFRISQAIDMPGNVAPDSLVMVYDIKEIARTDAFKWNDSIISRIDNLEYYRPARWTLPTRQMSAVAWAFGRSLADSLKSAYGREVPVGIISNPVGGSGTESWIDIETIEHNTPDALVGWKNNDWLQPWVQKRISQNIGDQNSHRHPYEPSYLFAAGIRPLKGFPIKGVIWYQGESNAHNTELHETYFKMLVDSWRREFSNPSMPFITAQLSSLNRPSWPLFRDSQRRLAENIDGVEMVVTSDVGDPTDVHPRKKMPVGQRMARVACAKIYGLPINHEGPLPIKATAFPDGTVRLAMSNARILTTSDGNRPLTFELAEIDGHYFPADATIADSTIILKSADVKNPEYVRYGWQPYTDANVINGDSLPTSTFRIKVTDTDNGIGYGVSGAFGGILPDGTVVIAGGCNFPFENPTEVDSSEKKIYSGIYNAMTGERIGMLPSPTAYGGSVSTPEGIAMLGGLGKTECFIFNGTELKPLPSLPVSIDNGYAASINGTIYALGKSDIYSLDPGASQWQLVTKLPEEPRSQPVMAGCRNKLYIWGGFTPSVNGSKPIVHTSGLCYDVAKHKWSKLPAPKVNGEEVTLSGGTAICDSNGTIYATGGVNRKIFLDAITCQAPDYLAHPIEWYQFNSCILAFNTKNGKWKVIGRSSDMARAGAAAVIHDGKLMLLGGELKPRVRATSTASFELPEQ